MQSLETFETINRGWKLGIQNSKYSIIKRPKYKKNQILTAKRGGSWHYLNTWSIQWAFKAFSRKNVTDCSLIFFKFLQQIPNFWSRKSRNSRQKCLDASRLVQVSRLSKVSSLDAIPKSIRPFRQSDINLGWYVVTICHDKLYNSKKGKGKS